jgi:hypothetical protein
MLREEWLPEPWQGGTLSQRQDAGQMRGTSWAAAGVVRETVAEVGSSGASCCHLALLLLVVAVITVAGKVGFMAAAQGR